MDRYPFEPELIGTGVEGLLGRSVVRLRLAVVGIAVAEFSAEHLSPRMVFDDGEFPLEEELTSRDAATRRQSRRPLSGPLSRLECEVRLKMQTGLIPVDADVHVQPVPRRRQLHVYLPRSPVTLASPTRNSVLPRAS